jgi:hypothetical protein
MKMLAGRSGRAARWRARPANQACNSIYGVYQIGEV